MQSDSLIPARPLRRQLLGVAMLTTLTAVLVAIAGLLVYDILRFQRAAMADLSVQADVLAQLSAPALLRQDGAQAQVQLARLAERPHVRAGAIYGSDGRLFVAYRAVGALQNAPPRAGTDGLNAREGDVWLFHPVRAAGARIGTVYLRQAYPLAAHIRDALLIGATVTAAALLVAFLLARRLGQRLSGPVTALTALARSVAQTRDYSQRAVLPAQGELRELGQAFHALLDEIETRARALEAARAEAEHEVQQRRAAQEEVMRLNAELEARVLERTAQLETAIAAARQASQAKTTFLSSMSHELRTPLNAVLGFAQILAGEQNPATPEQQREFAQHILRSGRHLLSLINDILDLAKIESGAIALSLEPVELGAVLTEVHAMIAPMAAGRGVRVLFPERASVQLQADRTRLKQVLLNLLTNAVKYNREQGAVVLDCAPAGAGRMRISVQDTGHGLSSEQLSQLFEPFNRLGQESSLEEGTGIGLVVTKRLVELMDGGIGVSSSLGVGSVFWIELALAAGQAENTAAPAPPPPERGPECGKTILYIEDNPANLKLVQEILRLRPATCLLSATDGHGGIELARREHPQLILLDLNLPGLSGLDTLQELRRDPATAAIPVIALTANAMPRDIERGMRLGFARYLTKPINIPEFTAAIDAVLATTEAAP